MFDHQTRQRHANSPLTTAQKNYLIVLLKRAGFLSAKVRGGHTGPQWRPLFSIANTREPADPLHWPSVDTWIDALTIPQGHDVIRHLKKQVGDIEAVP